MVAVNHMLMGAVIGAGFASPIVVPIALLSHYVLDILPHYGSVGHGKRMDDHVWKVDTCITISLLIYISYFAQLDYRLWTLVGAVVAVLPDLAWVYRFAVVERFGSIPPQPPKSFVNTFHADIQKLESPDRLWIEAVAFVGLLGIFIGTIS